jgi:orotate phosphoribosyltransferase
MDPEAAENDDGRRYGAFLRNARPLVLPRHEVGWLVTSRLERYRPETEDWLARHGVRYRHLLMMDYPNQAARQQARAYDSFKAAAYLDTGADLFIESAPHTAAGIARLASRPVFCFATREMIDPEAVARQQYSPVQPPHTAMRALRWGVRLPGRIVRSARRTLVQGSPIGSSREIAD